MILLVLEGLAIALPLQPRVPTVYLVPSTCVMQSVSHLLLATVSRPARLVLGKVIVPAILQHSQHLFVVHMCIHQ
jgi:hypothetical protein